MSSKAFNGIARLFGESALLQFQQTHICIIGVGGVGSWAVEALARSAIGKLTLIDLDHLSESNINRQLPALQSTLGQAKVIALQQRVLDINPDCQVNIIEDFIQIAQFESLIPLNCHYIIDCIDNAKIKAGLIAWAQKQQIPLIVSGSAGGKINPLNIRITDLRDSEYDPLLARIRKQLKTQYGFSRNLKTKFKVPVVWSAEHIKKPTQCDSSLNCAGYGSFTPVTAGFGMAMVSYVLEQIRMPSEYV